MAGVNKSILIGFLGKDPEVKTFQDGSKVANFSMATTESYKNKNGEKVDQTEWHNIVMWRGLAEIAEKWLKKGSQVYIEGKIATRSWEDKDGNKKYTTEIIANQMTMLGGGNKNENQTPNVKENQTQQNNETVSAGEEDDLPF